jgi:hypothetical protein
MCELMDGVQLLSLTTIKGANEWAMVFTILFSVGVLLGLVVLVGTSIEYDLSVTVPLVLFELLLIIALMISVASLDTAHKEQTFYKVLILEDVNFKEFTKRYEIIRVEDEIYTIIEKTEVK